MLRGSASTRRNIFNRHLPEECTLKCGNSVGAARVTAQSLDTSLVSIGRKTAFPTPLTPLSQRELSAGVFFVLHNNIWDTNYAAWYPWTNGASANSPMADGTDRFRFSFEFIA